MSKAGRAAARDIRFGRRAGRWSDDVSQSDVLLEEIHRGRLRRVARGEWPEESLVVWRALAAQARELAAEGRPLDEVLQRALEVVDAEAKFVARTRRPSTGDALEATG